MGSLKRHVIVVDPGAEPSDFSRLNGSPLTTPRSSSPRATASTSSASCRYVQRRPVVDEMPDVYDGSATKVTTPGGPVFNRAAGKRNGILGI